MRAEYRRYLWAWLALMGLLALTLGSAYLKMGIWNSVANLGIAVMKALIVLLLFMHLRLANATIRIYASIGLFTLALLFLISGSDYLTRATHDAPWFAPPATASPAARIEGPAPKSSSGKSSEEGR